MRLSRLWQCREPFIWLYDFAARRRILRGTREQLEESHARRFRRLVRYVAKHSPYYREVMQERGLDLKTCRPDEFPVLTRQLLIERFDDIVTDRSLSQTRIGQYFDSNPPATKLLDDRYFAIHSSGTSGNRIFMAYTPREWIRGVSHHVRFAGGLRLRKRCVFLGLTHGRLGGYGMAMTGKRGINRLFFDCRGVDIELATSEMVRRLNEIQPQVLSGYSSVLAGLADERLAGNLKIQPERIVSSGEMLLPEQRRYIEDVFNVAVIDVYAATELLAVGLSTAPDRMTLLEDDLMFDLRDDHYCVTSLFHRTVPLIRYQMEDRFELLPEASSSPLRSVRRVFGRSCELMTFLNNRGEAESIASFALLGIPVHGVVQIQFLYQGVNAFCFRVKLEPRLSESQREKAISDVRRWLKYSLQEKQLDRSVRFTVEAVEQISADSRTGKVPLVVDETSQMRAA